MSGNKHLISYLALLAMLPCHYFVKIMNFSLKPIPLLVWHFFEPNKQGLNSQGRKLISTSNFSISSWYLYQVIELDAKINVYYNDQALALTAFDDIIGVNLPC